MSDRSMTIALAPPRAEGWDFGDYPYALEPLTLPAADTSWSSAAVPGPDLDEVYQTLVGTARDRTLTTKQVTVDGLEELFWFRWIVGHHISFVIWRLLHDALARLSEPGGDQHANARAITEYVRGYSAMLLYTASSTPGIYTQVIRPSMYRLHTTFSGTWSPDYAGVRSVFRGRNTPPVVASAVEPLKAEIRLSHQIHLGVAAQLVQDGRSLLQHLVDNPVPHQPRIWGAIFDCYFLTVRAPISGYELAAQLLRRCKAVITDLAANGLYPAAAHYPESSPPEMRVPAILACERDISDVLLRVAELATTTLRPGCR